MAKIVVLTQVAKSDLEDVIEYLIHKWGITAANNFVDRAEQILALLSHSSGIFPYFDKTKQIQKCIITKHNVLYFKETEHTVDVITVFDTRQDPNKLNTLL